MIYFCRFVKQIGQGRKKEDVSGSSPKKRTHGKGVAQALVGSFLPTKAGEGVKTVRVVEALLVLSMAALHLSIAAGSIGADEPAANSQLSGRCLKEGSRIAPSGRKAIGELKTVVGLNALGGNAFAGNMGL